MSRCHMLQAPWKLCGIPAEFVVYFVAFADFVVGMAFLFFIIFYVCNICLVEPEQTDDEHLCYKAEWLFSKTIGGNETGLKGPSKKTPWNRSILTWMPTVSLVCVCVQCVMSFVLYYGANKKSRKICLCWVVSAIVTLAFTGLILRFYQILIVAQFCRELYRPAGEQHAVTTFGIQSNLRSQPLQSSLSKVDVVVQKGCNINR